MRHKLPPPKGPREDVIVFSVGGFSFAISAAAVSEIRDAQGLQPFAGSELGCPEKVSHTLQRNGSLYFVVDAARQFDIWSSNPARVMILRLAATAVLVDSTDRMAEISVLHALPQAFSGEERKWYRGLTLFGEDVVPVVNHQAFLGSGDLSVLRSAALQLRGAAVV